MTKNQKPKAKYVVTVFFTPYAMVCGSILNDYPEELTTMQTWAVSSEQAEKNVRFRFLRDMGTNGHPLSQFAFVAERTTS